MRHSLIVITTVALTACAGSPAPPDVPPSDVTGYPALTDGPYATHIARGSFPASAQVIRDWINADSRIVYALPDTKTIPRPVDFEVLSGTWPEEGAVRRLEFSDGHFALERVLDNRMPDSFSYQVWGFTSSVGDNISYIYGVQEMADTDQGSELIWTYNLKPNAGWKRPFVNRFARNDIGPFLNSAVTTVERQAQTAFPREVK